MDGDFWILLRTKDTCPWPWISFLPVILIPTERIWNNHIAGRQILEGKCSYGSIIYVFCTFSFQTNQDLRNARNYILQYHQSMASLKIKIVINSTFQAHSKILENNSFKNIIKCCDCHSYKKLIHIP